MAERRPLVLDGGSVKELPSGDTLPATPLTGAQATLSADAVGPSSSTWGAIALNTLVTAGGLDLSLASGELAVNEAGTYHLVCAVTLDATGGSGRDEYLARLNVYSGGAWADVVTKPLFAGGLMQPTGYVTMAFQALLTLAAGDRLRLEAAAVAASTSVTSSVDADGTSLVLLKLT